MGGDFRRHSHGDAVGSVYQKVGKAGGKDQRFAVFPIVIVSKIDRVAFKVDKQFGGNRREPCLGITHRGGGEAGYRSKIPLAVNKAMTHVPVLGHPHKGGINHLLTMRMVALHRFPNDTGAFGGRGGRPQIEVVHGHKDTPLRWF